MATLGDTSILANDSNLSDGWLIGYRVQAGGSFTALSMYCYVRSTWPSGGVAVFGIYSDVATLPDTLLGQTTEISSNAADEWRGVDLQSGVTITSGEWYWLTLHADTPSFYSLVHRTASASGKYAARTSGTYSTTMSASFVENITGTRTASIYASSTSSVVTPGQPATANVYCNLTPTDNMLANLTPSSNVTANPSPTVEVYNA